MSRWSEPELPPELLRMRGRIDLDPLHGGSCLKATCSVRLTGEPMVAKDKVSSLQIQLNYQFLFDSLKLRIVKQSFLFVFYEIENCKTKCLVCFTMFVRILFKALRQRSQSLHKTKLVNIVCFPYLVDLSNKSEMKKFQESSEISSHQKVHAPDEDCGS